MAICIGIVSTFLLATLLVAAISRAPDFCFASLLWLVKPYAKGVFAVLLGVSVVLLIVIIAIFVKLSKSRMVDPTERMAASRMIYYLILGFISNVSDRHIHLISPVITNLDFRASSSHSSSV